MVPKFANPHSLSQDVAITTRSEIAERAGAISVVHDESCHSLKRDLDALLRDTWADALAETSGRARTQRPRKMPESRENKDRRIAFHLISSMKHPKYISLEPKSPPVPVSRGPDCEDDETQAEARRMCALAAAVEIDRLGEAAVATRRIDLKSVETKLSVASMSLVQPLPPLVLIEETRIRKAVWPVKIRTQTSENAAASPHEPQVSCLVLPVESVSDHREAMRKKQKRRNFVKERPAPAYWKPAPELRGKCMGYALGYPSSWAPG